MEFGTIIGLILAVVGILGGMVMKGVGFENLANSAAILIILVGTVGTVFNAIPLSSLSKVGSLFRIVLFGPKTKINNTTTIEEIMKYAQMVREDSILALEKVLDEMKNPLMRRGFELLLLAHDTEDIENILNENIEAMEQRHLANAQIFSQAGAYAPTLGVMGAVIGLIAAMGYLDNQDELAHAIGGAFMATVYGIFTGYVLWHPFANRLKSFSKKEAINMAIIREGVIAIAHGYVPDVVKEKMMAYLDQKQKDKLSNLK